MKHVLLSTLTLAATFSVCAAAGAAPNLVQEKGRVVVTGQAYRATFSPEALGFDLEIKGPEGQWRRVTANAGGATFAYMGGAEAAVAGASRATWAVRRDGEAFAIGQQVPLDREGRSLLDLHVLCTDAGLLLGGRLAGPEAAGASLWLPPRLALAPAEWEGYLFWDAAGKAHQGKIAGLDPCPAYAGVSSWGKQGDTAPALDPARPALVVHPAGGGSGLGIVFVGYRERWAGTSAFLQRHTPRSLYLYAGMAPGKTAAQTLWAWLAPLPAEAGAAGARVADLAAQGERLAAGFRPFSTPAPAEWARPMPPFPAGLKRPEPVRDLNEAAVYTIAETTRTPAAMELHQKVGSDVLIRAWFKWARAPRVAEMRALPEQAHRMGAVFGGGITCSALYDNENDITREQLLDMATRSPAGDLVDAWDTPGIRHGSLSCPAYMEYLFRWCREQIDAGADYLFMDEHQAALSAREGYDDHSLTDFRRFLREECPATRALAPADARWSTEYGVPLDDPKVCPDGTMATFAYRGYLRAKGLLESPTGAKNPLTGAWHQFRRARDDRAWKALTDRIRAYAREKGRTVWISANGLAPYVDLQVLGVWGQFSTRDGRVDLSENQLPHWRSLVRRGHLLAGKRVPVVLFHDWGFGDPPFPWMAVPITDRELWMRTRAAEIYAAGALFAFPVLGPFGCDAARDRSLGLIARQTAFYQRHRDLYLKGRYLGTDGLRAAAAGQADRRAAAGTADRPAPAPAAGTPSVAPDDSLSLAAWWSDERRALVLHVVNRDVDAGGLRPRKRLRLTVDVGSAAEKVAVLSPEWEGERPGSCRLVEGQMAVEFPDFEAYAVAVLPFAAPPDLSRLHEPVRAAIAGRWERPERSEFAVRRRARIEHADDLVGYLQGMLHKEMRNPPTFVVNALAPGKLLVKVRAVAMAGARLEYRVDGAVAQSVDLPDLDKKNAGDLPEYDRVFEFPVPAGKHRLTLDNVGGDWAVLTWLEFQGDFGD